MRQIGTLPDGDAARRLADYLLTLQIETRLEQQTDGWIVWVCDEDRVAQARQEITEFLSHPADARFANAGRTAHELRLREIEEDEDYRERLTEFRERMTDPVPQGRYVTFALIVVAILVTLATNFGEKTEGLLPYLWISSTKGPALIQIAHGEVWRLVTPIFIHFNVMHLAFNCLIVANLAGQVERQQGSARLVWLVFLFAVLSNVAQFYFGHPTIGGHEGIKLDTQGVFGGLSGVGYGLFGYVWMKSRLEPSLGMQLSSLTVTIMIVWFVACFTGLMGPIANATHAAGLGLGLLVGAGPQLWQTLRGR